MSQYISSFAGQGDNCNSSFHGLWNKDNVTDFRVLRSLQRKITVQPTSSFLYTTVLQSTCSLADFYEFTTVRSLQNRSGWSGASGLHYSWGITLLRHVLPRINILEGRKHLKGYISSSITFYNTLLFNLPKVLPHNTEHLPTSELIFQFKFLRKFKSFLF